MLRLPGALKRDLPRLKVDYPKLNKGVPMFEGILQVENCLQVLVLLFQCFFWAFLGSLLRNIFFELLIKQMQEMKTKLPSTTMIEPTKEGVP